MHKFGGRAKFINQLGMNNSGEILKEWQTSGASRSPDLNFMVSESKKFRASRFTQAFAPQYILEQ